MQKILSHILLSSLLFSKAVKVEEILSDTNQIKLDISTTYINFSQKSNSFDLINYQTLGGDYITIPTFTGDSLISKDILNYSLNLKYGFSKTFELFSYIVGNSSFTKVSSSEDIKSREKSEFSTLGIGGIYQIRQEDTYPSLLIGGSSQIINRTQFNNGHKNSNLKSNSIFISSYYTTDPIVFFIKSSFQKNEQIAKNNLTIKNGNILSIEPQLYFAVNPYTSLNFGFNYAHQGKNYQNDLVISNSESTISYIFGMNYEINFKSVISIDINLLNTSQYSQNTTSFNYSYKF